MILFIRGRLIPESRNPISRITQALYLPVLRLCLRFRKTTLLLNLVFLIVTLPLALHIGSQFMPPLFEGSALYMPTALPGISIGQASQLLQEQDRIIRTFPEVETVFGSIGRSDSATDNAPLDMYDTTIMLKPRNRWRQGMTSGIGGEMVAENVEGRERYPVNVRYNRDFRDNVEGLRRLLIGTPSGAQIPISEVAKVSFSRGPSMIRDEDGALTGYVYIDLNTKDYGGFVTHASDLLKQKLPLPPSFTYKSSGEYDL